jgi:hypothetical protein
VTGQTQAEVRSKADTLKREFHPRTLIEPKRVTLGMFLDQ